MSKIDWKSFLAVGLEVAEAYYCQKRRNRYMARWIISVALAVALALTAAGFLVAAIYMGLRQLTPPPAAALITGLICMAAAFSALLGRGKNG